MPFAAVVAQEQMKKALLLNAVNPKLSGVLIRGEKGTAKSTTVRALAQLLSDVQVVEGCPYSCHPCDRSLMCDGCLQRVDHEEELPVVSRQVRVVNLPVNATEDRVIGGIDFEKALREGHKSISPGLLAEANRGILYVDEVNLLGDHIIDMLLDSAAMGVNIIEREGLSYAHPAQFILVGTMNPEEGELGPQLLDRFGLCVMVEGITDLEDRLEILKRQQLFDYGPQEFLRSWIGEQETLRCRIIKAQQLLPQITIFPRLMELISRICLENRTAGHRADILMQKTACTLAAFYGRKVVSPEDILEAADLVLPHRARPPLSTAEREKLNKENRSDDSQEENSKQDQGENFQNIPSNPNDQFSSALGKGPQGEVDDSKQNSSSLAESAFSPVTGQFCPSSDDLLSAEAQAGDRGSFSMFGIGEAFQVRPISLGKDRKVRRGSGRRSSSKTIFRSGRYVRSTSARRNNDLAFDATIRAAAPHQRKRLRREVSIAIEEEDIREKIRERKIGNLLLFAVDASGSMGTKLMMETKGAIFSLHLDAYQKRDKVGFVAFREAQAEILLPPTDSIDLARKLLEDLPTGGKTPLSEGMLTSYEIIIQQLRKDPCLLPLLILVSDCRANVPLSESRKLSSASPGKGFAYVVSEALEIADKIRKDGRIKTLLIDVNEELTSGQLSLRLAQTMGAQYFRLEDLQTPGILEAVESQRVVE